MTRKKYQKNYILALISGVFIIVFFTLIFQKRATGTFKKTPLGSSWDYQSVLSLPNTTVSIKTTPESGVVDFQYQNSSIQFDTPLNKPSIKNSQKNEISFVTKEKNIELQYQTLKNGLKENIILRKIPTTNQFYSSIKTTNADIYFNSSHLPVFLNPKNQEYLFHIQKPYAFDATGNKTYGIEYQIIINNQPIIPKTNGGKFSLLDSLTKIDQKDSYQLVVKIDPKWLFAKDRVYPIIIDPTIIHDTTSEFATGQFNRIKNNGAGETAPSLESYYQELGTDINTVGLWHLNESSGNALDSSGNSNTGTPTGTTIVSGLLGNARSFNGSSDNIGLAASTNANVTGDISVEMWIKPNLSANGVVIHKDSQFSIEIGATGDFFWADSSNWSYAGFGATNIGLVTNKWQHLAVTKSNGIVNVYLDGVLKSTKSFGSAITSTTNIMRLGCYANASACTSMYYNGSIDEVRVSNIARSPEEIKLDASRRPYSVFTSDIIDLTNVSSWNSISWTGTGFTTGDGETPSSTTGLVAQWNFNETSGTSAVSGGTCGSSCNGTLTNMTTTGQDAAINTGWTYNNRRWGAGALMFDGTNDYVTCTDANCGGIGKLDIGTGSWSVSTWVKTTNSTARQILIAKGDSTGQYSWEMDITSPSIGAAGAPTFILYNTGDGGYMYTPITKPISDGYWHNIVGTYDGTTISIYIDGVLSGSSTTKTGTQVTNSTGPLSIGDRGSSSYVNGIMDSISVYSRALTTSEILANYNSSRVEVQTRVGNSSNANDGSWETWQPSDNEKNIASMDYDYSNWYWDYTASHMPNIKSNDNNIKVEGSGSMRVQTGVGQTNPGTAALWHLDETTGTGAYIRDASTNNNSGTPTGTTLTEGISGKARTFNGTSDLISFGNPSSLQILSSLSLEAWVKTSAAIGYRGIVSKMGTGAPYYGYLLRENSTGYAEFGISTTGSNYTSVSGTTLINDGEWHHIVGTYTPYTYLQIYVDGVLQNTNSTSISGAIYNTSGNVIIGCTYTTPSECMSGSIDEVKISNTTRSAEEIAETYRMSRDHLFSKTINTVDLDSSTKLPFYVASDRLGTFSQLTIEESPVTDYQPDSNTVGLWHLDEQSGSGAYLRDSSGYGNNGTPTGTTFAQGKIGKARYFNGSTDYISVPNSSALNFGSNSFTIDWWEYRTDASSTRTTMQRHYSNDGVGYAPWIAGYSNGTSLLFYASSCGNTCGWDVANARTMGPITLNQWVHLAVVRNGTTFTTYKNSIPQDTWTSSLAIQNGIDVLHIGKYWTGGTYSFLGYIDEVRISNTARTADQIRQTFEMGNRTHNITFDFKAKLSSGNLLIGSTDYSFTVDETAYGSSAMANHIFLGDKIIVKENIGGTEFLSQGTVNSVNATTGALTVSSWDTTSTFPSGGYTVNATVFKWQREYFDITNSLSTQRDAITKLIYRITDGSVGANIWIDDFKHSTGYLSNSTGSSISSSVLNRYFQYRLILSQNDNFAPSVGVNTVTLSYNNNQAPSTPTLNSPSDAATNQSLYPTLKTTGTDPNSDNLQYKITLCSNALMTTNCQIFDQTISNTGWSGQNVGTSAFSSGTQASYTLQNPLIAGQIYYWKSMAIDPTGSNTWGSTQSTPYSFTVLNMPTNCLLQKSNNNSSINVIWNTDSISTLTIEKNTDSAGFTSLTNLSIGTSSYLDTNVSSGHTYKYRIAYYTAGPIIGNWCETPTLNLQNNNDFLFNGLKLNGLQIN